MGCAEYVVLYSWDGTLPVERWQIKAVGRATQTHIDVVNTTAAAVVDCFVRVQARNSHGFGPKSNVVRLGLNAAPSSARLGSANRELKCADTIGTVPVPWAGRPFPMLKSINQFIRQQRAKDHSQVAIYNIQ